MTTRAKPFLELDAGEQREFLAEQLADWIEAEFWPTPRADAFHRRAKILARSVGMTRVELMDVLRSDAEVIVAKRAATPRSATCSTSAATTASGDRPLSAPAPAPTPA